jgi:hypothetical protein
MSDEKWDERFAIHRWFGGVCVQMLGICLLGVNRRLRCG